MNTGSYVPSSSELELDAVPDGISSMILSCWALDPLARPDLNFIFQSLRRVYPQRSGMSFSASIVDRLMHYSNELEE